MVHAGVTPTGLNCKDYLGSSIIGRWLSEAHINDTSRSQYLLFSASNSYLGAQIPFVIRLGMADTIIFRLINYK